MQISTTSLEENDPSCLDQDMSSQKFFHLLLIFGAGLSILGTLLFFRQNELPIGTASHHSNLIGQNTNTYLGPNQKTKGNSQLVRIQILVYNDPDPKGVTIVDADFDGANIPLKPRDIYGFRGQASFQKRGGKYKLRWEVERNGPGWPKTVTHEEQVTVDPNDLWIQITIVGDKAEIS